MLTLLVVVLIVFFPFDVHLLLYNRVRVRVRVRQSSLLGCLHLHFPLVSCLSMGYMKIGIFT
jgi:hypothetical protein